MMDAIHGRNRWGEGRGPAGAFGEAAAVGLIEARRRGIPTPPIGNTGALPTWFITGSPRIR